MRKSYILEVLISVLTACSAFAQGGYIPDVTFPVLRHPAPGYYLLAPNGVDAVALVDHAGKNVFPVPAMLPANLVCTDSTLTYFDQGARGFVRLNARFVAIDTLFMSGEFGVDFHEGHVLSNGNYVILGTEMRIMNLSAVVPGGSSEANVIGAVFQERTMSGATVFEWKSLDYIPVVDATEDIDLRQETIDYIHVNSVFRDTDGNYLVSCRHTDEIIKVSRQTGGVVWRMGGQKSKGNQFTFINDNVDGFIGFSHQHDASRTANGRILLYDNGALKPTQYSRVAEYEVNEVNKTAKLVWSYRPTPDVFTANMGSVQELSNGSILIGYGSSNTTMIAQEITRDGTVQAEIKTVAATRPYRVRKAVFAMSGTERVVTGPGTITFTEGDSTTHFRTVLSRVDAKTSIIAERHSYTPHNLSFAGADVCVPMPMRWVVRASNVENLAGSMRFNIGSFGIAVPTLLELYQRPLEGVGSFTRVTAVYDAASTSLVYGNFKQGEYLIAYPMCYDPVPNFPGNNAGNISNTPTLRWTVAVQTGGYDVELYKGSSAFGTPIRSFHTMRLDTSLTLLEPGVQYSWRVRALRPAPNTNGPWSISYTFRTRLGTPVALSPSSLPDSIAIQQNATFRWTRVKNATRYRVRIVPLGTSTPALDTIVSDTAFTASSKLLCDQTMFWSVRGEVDTSSSDWSNTLFIVTPPCAPRLLSPLPETQGVSPDVVTCTWTSVNDARLYHIRVYKNIDGGTSWFEDSITTTETDIFDMSSVTTYHWQVRTIGRYGPGPWSDTRWFMTRGQSVLGVATLLSPVAATGVDTLQATLTWASVLEATSYHVQATTKSTFAKPDVEWRSVNTTTLQCPPLAAGKLYRWRVMALNDIASSPWSDTALFSTLPGPDDALEPLTPISGTVDAPVRGMVSFISDKRFNEYRVEYSLVPLFTAVEQTATVTAATAPYSLQPEQQYWWRVVGLKNGLATDTGSTATFTTGKDDVTSVDEPTAGHSASVSLLGTTLTLQGAVQGADVRVIDIAGRSVYQHTVLGVAHSREDLSHLSTGVYIALIRLADSRVIVYSFVLSNTR